jgi:hydrogenase nickel incorporation protein HypB
MCETCGCGSDAMAITNLETGKRIDLGLHEHVHEDGTRHVHVHDHTTSTIELNAHLLEKNERAAERNRAWLRGREVFALNLMSAPGAGKTTLLERSIAALKTRHDVFVLEGDQAKDRDGARARKAGARAVQINTGRGCHLDAEMVARGIAELKPAAGSVLFIENVGNLVCPALFDLGEEKRVAILSVTEGDDKPVKYPHMFERADLVLLNKIDLLPHVDFDVEKAVRHARAVNPKIEMLPVSAKTGDGMNTWHEWIQEAHSRARTFA